MKQEEDADIDVEKDENYNDDDGEEVAGLFSMLNFNWRKKWVNVHMSLTVKLLFPSCWLIITVIRHFNAMLMPADEDDDGKINFNLLQYTNCCNVSVSQIACTPDKNSST